MRRFRGLCVAWRHGLVMVMALGLLLAAAGAARADAITDPGGLLYHLDAALGISLDSGTVSMWADQGPLVNSFFGGGFSSQPTVAANAIGGLPAVRFDGNNQELIMGNPTQPQTFVAVTNVFTGGGLRGIWGGEGQDKGIRLNSNTNYRGFGQNSDGNDFANGDANGIRVNGAITTAYQVNTPHIIVETRGPNFNATTFNVTSLGEYYGSRDYDGDVAEVAVYNHILSVDQIIAVEQQLGTKYGIAVANQVPQPGTIRGTGTGALLGGKTLGGVIQRDLTDPENNGYRDANVNYDAIFTSTDEPGFGGGEFSFNVFDNRVGGGNDKWCCNGPPHDLTAELAAPVVLDRFTLTSSNDTPARDPRVWAIQGSNDGVSFTDIFAQDEPSLTVWTARNQVRLYEGDGVDFDEPAAYKYFRYHVGQTGGGNHALNEIELFSDAFNLSYVPPASSFNTRMVAIVVGGGSNDNDINNTTEAVNILTNATGTGPITIGSKNYNVGTFVESDDWVIDMAGGNGDFAINNPYPNGATGGGDFAVGVQAFARIQPGTYRVAIGSDDGGTVRLEGIGAFDSRFGTNGTQPNPDEARYEGTRGHNRTGGDFTLAHETLVNLQAAMFERGGGDSFELSVASGDGGWNAGQFVPLENGTLGWRVARTQAELALRVEVGGDNAIGTDTRPTVLEDVAMGPLTGAKTIQVVQNRNDTFQVSELQAFETGTGVNVAEQATGGVATVTSFGWGGVPTRANDGDTRGNWGAGTTWHSAAWDTAGATLTIDLLNPAALDSVHFWGRTDTCCDQRQDDFNLIIRDSANRELFNQQLLGVGTSPGSNQDIPVDMIVSADIVAELFTLDTYVFELDAGGNSDQIAIVNPNADVFNTILDVNDATIEFEAISGNIQVGDLYQILSADEIVGQFDSIIHPTNLPKGLFLYTDRLLADGTVLVVTPEPATAILVGVGLIACIRRRRRRKGA